MKKYTKVFILSTICGCLLLTGCSGATKTIIRNTPYNKVWDAGLAVKESYGPYTAQTKQFGITVFESGEDKEKGEISFVSGPLVLGHTENMVKMREEGRDVELSVWSKDRFVFLPGSGRRKDQEEKIIAEIEANLVK